MSLYFIPTVPPLIMQCSCNDVNNPYVKLCALDVLKSMNIKVFNLMSGTNETHHMSWHETCACHFKLNASVCKDRQRWNSDKYKCECKELTDKGRRHDRFIWNPSTCECEYDTSCDFGEYLRYVNCKCRKRLIDKLVEKLDEDIMQICTVMD